MLVLRIVLEVALKRHYQKVADDVAKGFKSEAALDAAPGSKTIRTFQASDTLATKVMLGRLACRQAYDTYLMRGEKVLGIRGRGFGERSLSALGELCASDQELLRGLGASFGRTAGHPCPDMKALDLLLWRIGRRGTM